jgi:hypothetical protein
MRPERETAQFFSIHHHPRDLRPETTRNCSLHNICYQTQAIARDSDKKDNLPSFCRTGWGISQQASNMEVNAALNKTSKRGKSILTDKILYYDHRGQLLHAPF